MPTNRPQAVSRSALTNEPSNARSDGPLRAESASRPCEAVGISAEMSGLGGTHLEYESPASSANAGVVAAYIGVLNRA